VTPAQTNVGIGFSQAEKAILGWAEAPIRDDLCVPVMKPQ
jgi:hypothetical protein